MQANVALSTTESEYMVAIETSKKALWLRALVETSVSYRIQFKFIATVRVQFILQKITSITSGRNILM